MAVDDGLSKMKAPTIAPYGTWQSPITSELITSSSIKLSHSNIFSGNYYWLEARPQEAGRCVVVCRNQEGETLDLNPAPFNVRNTAHEYGGGAFTLHDNVLYFCNFADQRIYRQKPGGKPETISKPCPSRFADLVVDSKRNRLLFIREDHSWEGGEAITSLDYLSLDGKGEIETLLTGSDFFSSPKVSPDGRLLSWITWNHPNMPWDETKLWLGNLGNDGSLSNVQQVAGGNGESVMQPEWGTDGTLYFISDRNGYWNLYSAFYGEIEPLLEMEAEFGYPPWIFGQSTYSIESEKRIICAFNRKGLWRLGSIDLPTKKLTEIETPYKDISFVKAQNGKVIFRAGSPTDFLQIVLLDLDSGKSETLQRSNNISLANGFLSAAQTIEFESADKERAHAFFYPPQNQDFAGPVGEKPPLIVKSHGGPTAACTSTLDLGIQYWTSRGFAVVDVNYGGSTGYGKNYRKRLDGKWGVVDVDDCVMAADFLCQTGQADMKRLIITGSSAGGYTTLCALTFRDKFKAGASYYGISDLEALIRDTHKFEARYTDRLVGPYPERKDLYIERSPLHFAKQIKCPVIFFQGEEDKVVPQVQSEHLVTALRQKKMPVAYLLFPGEQHGFRKAETIKRCLDAELGFYCRIFGIARNDLNVPLPIENLPDN